MHYKAKTICQLHHVACHFSVQRRKGKKRLEMAFCEKQIFPCVESACYMLALSCNIATTYIYTYIYVYTHTVIFVYVYSFVVCKYRADQLDK